MKKNAALLMASLCALCSSVQADDRTILDWKSIPANDPPPPWIESVQIKQINDPEVRVVDAKSSPPSPFPGGRPCLYVAPGTGHKVHVIALPFSTPSPKGWIEMEAVLEKENLAVELGVGAKNPLTPGSTRNYDGTIIVRCLLRPNLKPLLIPMPHPPEKTSLSPVVDAGVPTKFRMRWDFTGEEPYVEFLVDGQKASVHDDEDYRMILPKDLVAEGVDCLRIFPNDGYLGNITASE